MKKKLIQFLIFFLFGFFILFLANEVFKSESSRVYLEFQILETEWNVGKYILEEKENLGFIPYVGGHTPSTRPMGDRMITLRANFYPDQFSNTEEIYLVSVPVEYPCHIYLNGHKIAKRGNFEGGYTSRIHQTVKYLLPPEWIQKNKQNEIAFQLYPKEGETNPFSKVFLSSARDADHYVFWRTFLNSLLVKAFAISSVIIGIYFLFRFFSHTDQLEYLYFSLMNFSYILGYYNNLISYDYVNTLVAEKIVRAFIPLTMLFGTLFFAEYFKFQKYKKQIQIITIASLGIATIYPQFFSSIPEVIGAYNSFSYVIIFIAHLAILGFSLQAWRGGNKKALLIFIALLINTFSGAYDGFYFKIYNEKPYQLLSPIAIFFIIIAIFYLIAEEQVEIYRLSLEREAALRYMNENLDSLIKQRTYELKEKSEKLEEANRVKDKFFSIIAHDLRNPFSYLLGYAEFLMHDLENGNLNDLKKNIMLMDKSVKTTYSLLVNLLEWSRTQSGNIIFSPQTMDLHPLVQETMGIIHDSANSKDIAVTADVQDGLQVFADKHMLRMVLRNLMTNAIKFTQSGGSVRIYADRTVDFIRITVQDTGLGINAKNLQELFRADVKKMSRGTANEEGTGLGLMLCKEFIDYHKGNIEVESVLGKGSAFIVSLPNENKN